MMQPRRSSFRPLDTAPTLQTTIRAAAAASLAALLFAGAASAESLHRKSRSDLTVAPTAQPTHDSSSLRGIDEYGFTLGTQVPDGSFELGGEWTEYDDGGCDTWIGNWNSPIPFYPKAPDGTKTFWSGGCCYPCDNGADAHGGNVIQTVTVPSEDPYLVFWALIERDDLPDSAASDVAYVNFNGSSVWSVDVSTDANDTTLGGGLYCFVPVRIDMSAHVGQTKDLEVGMVLSPPVNATVANVVFDDFRWADLIFADSFECGGSDFWSTVQN